MRLSASLFFPLVLTSTLYAQLTQPSVRTIVGPPPTVSLEPLETNITPGMPESAPALPPSFRQFTSARVNEGAEVQTLALRFSASATLNRIQGTEDFRVVQGGSCVEGRAYPANTVCTLMVKFTPQGAGRRFGSLKVTNSADATPMSIGLGGNGVAPVISFTPSVINHIASTYPNSVGLLSGASNIAVDGGDILYIADTGNNLNRFIDASGTVKTLEGVQPSSPIGIGIDAYGKIIVTQTNPQEVIGYNSNGGSYYAQTGNNTCQLDATCGFSSSYQPVLGYVASDPFGTLFFSSLESAGEIVPNSGDFIQLADNAMVNFYEENSPNVLAVDGNDTIYSFYRDNDICFITGESFSSAYNDTNITTPVTNSKECGFGGDGGQARGATIGSSVGQMNFDAAGNLYFTDTTNQRVRRIDAATGLIETIAGNGTAGFAGDNGPATSAELANPTGVAVDSAGQVYIVSSTTATGKAQVVRVITTVGRLSFPVTAVGASASIQTVQVSNTGNATLNFANVVFTSGNTADFSIDPGTTNCIFTRPLPAGQSCKIGFLFKPGAAGLRAATLSITDDTLTGVNTVYVAGIGATTATLTPASIAFAKTNVGTSATAQTATLTNTGTAVLTISGIALSGTSKTSYSFTDTCGSTLASGAKCTISVIFKPTVAGSLAASLIVTDNAISATQAINLSGSGAATQITTPTKPKQPPVRTLP